MKIQQKELDKIKKDVRKLNIETVTMLYLWINGLMKKAIDEETEKQNGYQNNERNRIREIRFRDVV